MKKTIAIELLSALLMLLFIYASFSKYADFASFRQAMFRQPFSQWFSGILIYILPPLEIGIAVALIFDGSRLWAFRASLLLLSTFTLYISLILLHAFGDIPCSCGGLISALSWKEHLVFNLFFIFISILALSLELNLKRKAPLPINPKKTQA